MRKLKIGYWPLSQTLNSAGDRRRLVFWAKARGHVIVTDLSKTVDVIVASENSDFNSPFLNQKNIPIIFDLVDAYLSPLNPFDDFARGLAKRLSRQISGHIKPFSHHVRDFCMVSSAVICSSIEQAEVIKVHNLNTHVILDSHDEIPMLDPLRPNSRIFHKPRILWEGQPATLRGVRNISSALSELSGIREIHLDFVTDEKYFQILNKYFRRDTLELLKRNLGQLKEVVNIIPWTPENLVECAKSSTVAIIPITLSVPMQRLKPENRLLIMWRLGLPCLTSSSPSYVRVARQAGVDAICEGPEDWVSKCKELLNNPSFAYQEALRGQSYLSEMHNRNTLLLKWDRAIESVIK